MIIKNLIVYFKELNIGTSGILLAILSIYLSRIVIAIVKKKKFFETKIDYFEFIFFASFLCFLVIQLPWSYALTRYLMPALLFISLFMFVEVYQDYLILSKLRFVKLHRKIILFLSIMGAAYVLFLWGLDVVLKERSSISTQDVFQEMAKLPSNTTLLMNMAEGDATIELVDEIQIHLSEYWNRSDIKSVYLDINNLPRSGYVVIDSNQFPRKYSEEELQDRFGEKYFSIEKTSKRLVLTTPIELIKQPIKKIFTRIIRGEKINTEGLFTYYNNYSNWYFFNEK